MVPGPVANAILHSATLQLQKANHMFAGKNLVMGKFGEELLRQLSQTNSQQIQTITSHAGARPMTFIPGVNPGEAAAHTGGKNATSKRGTKKKREGAGTTSPLAGPSAKR